MARKTAFVNEMILKTLNQHQQTVPQTVQKAATLDDEVSEILNRKYVNDHDKAKLYSDVLQKYLTAKEQITPTGNLSPVVTQITSLSMYSNESTVPKKHKTRAENMLRFLRQSGKLHWKDDGRVLYQDREITDSNIADLINDQMRSRKTFNPRGWLPFTEALKEINVPNDLIGNPRRLNITTWSSVGKKRKPTASYAPKKEMNIETCVNGRRLLQSIRSRKFWRY